eukprot:TRINITY_DN708_c0_g1_i6.p2 TRINITY_DN708_c0_g1~~TRINITY_DN708_c0_g1_i6.p2  ORF type:complete len:188 (-),score=49.49 TRINITY_DN708_c0_g1_i6:138-701(-)
MCIRDRVSTQSTWGKNCLNKMFSSANIQPERVPGKECVWDYPRPAICEPTPKKLKVVFNGVTIAETEKGYRVLETSHPPSYYFPPEDCNFNYIKKNSKQTYCEWKGAASYFDLNVNGKQISSAGWFYENPTEKFQPMKGYLAFYLSKMDACYVNDEQAKSQEGDFYGGWLTDDITGPFKGGKGTYGW